MKTKLVLVLALALTVVACKKKTATPAPETPIDYEKNVGNIYQMVVPKGFTYKTSRSIPVTVTITDNTYGTSKQSIKIYDGNPLSNGNLIASGSCYYGKEYTSTIVVADAVDHIYVVRTAPDNSSVTSVVSGRTATINLTDLGKRGEVSLFKSAPPSPDCSIGCSSTVTGSNNVNVDNSSTVVCITGTFSGGININHGTVRICGNATVSNCSINNDGTLLIASSATVNFSNLNINGGSATMRNWSNNVAISGSFSPGGVVTNYGTMAMGSDLNINSAATVTNEGTMTVASNFNNNQNFINNGSLTVTGTFNQNGGGVLTNNCKFIINGQANINNPLTNNQYIKVAQTTTINGGGVVTMNDGSMWKTNNLTLNNIITGAGAASLVKVAANTTINGGGRLNGTLQFCDATGIETNFGVIATTVIQSCSLYIATSSCNPDGNGMLVIPDSDKDGANDNIDQYPNDPTMAFNNYYPSEKTLATAAYEDLWPSKGDYDMNDLVVDFRHNMITNASNEVVKYQGYYRLRAAGGAQKIAFAVKLPVTRGNVSKLDGATLEEGQDNAVLELFDNSKAELNGNWNTVMSQAKVEYKEYNVAFSLEKSVSLKEMGAVSEYDPFIWVNEKDKGRGYEIHLPGKTPTALFDESLFGYADDDSSPKDGKYFLTKGNLPWAILTPELFDYCVELTMLPDEKETPDITQVYLHFAQWAQSGGEYYKDWYKNEKGYRADKYIYSK